MKYKIFRMFSSNIKIKISGKNINNFIKKIIKNNIEIVRVIPISYKEADIIINYKHLEDIYKIKTIYNIDIIKYYGKLNILKFLKKNLYIFLFLILGIIIIYFLSNVIFSVEIIHSNHKIISLLEDELSNHGIKKFAPIKNYNEIEQIEDIILQDNKSTIEWLEIMRKGTKYIVRVEDRILNNNINDNKQYDIVASKNSVIKSITAESGEKVKEINTYVKKGEVIISSNITLPSNEKIQSTARGDVIGETWYTVNIEYPFYYNEVIYTGNKKKVLVFNFINKRVSFFDFDKYKSFDKNIKYIFRNDFIPVSLLYEYQYETKVVNDIYTYEEAREAATNYIKVKLLDSIDTIKDINKIVVVSEENMTSKIKLSLFISCLEEIGEYKEVIPIIDEETIQ